MPRPVRRRRTLQNASCPAYQVFAQSVLLPSFSRKSLQVQGVFGSFAPFLLSGWSVISLVDAVAEYACTGAGGGVGGGARGGAPVGAEA